MWCGSSRPRSRARTTTRTSISRPTASGRAGRPGSTTPGACSSARRGTIRSIPWKASWCTSFPGAPARRWRRPPENSGSEPDLVFTYVKTRSGSDPELLFFLEELLQRAPQDLELPAHRAAALADDEVRLEGGPLLEAQVAVLLLRHELGGALAGEVHLPNQFFSRQMRSAMRAR